MSGVLSADPNPLLTPPFEIAIISIVFLLSMVEIGLAFMEMPDHEVKVIAQDLPSERERKITEESESKGKC